MKADELCELFKELENHYEDKWDITEAVNRKDKEDVGRAVLRYLREQEG